MTKNIYEAPINQPSEILSLQTEGTAFPAAVPSAIFVPPRTKIRRESQRQRQNQPFLDAM